MPRQLARAWFGRLGLAALVGLALPAGAPRAQNAAVPEFQPELLLPRFPAGSVNTREAADAAIAAATLERAAQEKRYSAARNECQRKFLAERCLSDARQVNYQAMQRIREVELEARDFRRQEDARLKEATRAQKRATIEADAGRQRAEEDRKRSESQKRRAANDRSAREFAADAPLRAKRAREARVESQQRAAERARKDAEARARAPERAERARQHEARVREVLRRAAEKDAKAKQKRQAKPAATVPGDSTVPPVPGSGERSPTLPANQ